MLKNKLFVLISAGLLFFVHLAQAQVKDTVLKSVDTLAAKPIRAIRIDTTKKADTAKKKYINPGKVAGRKAVFRSLVIPGWGQLYNNQLLVRDFNAKGEKTGHFWQKTYTLGKIGLIYTGFTLLTLSYIDNTNSYRIFLKEAQARDFNKTQPDKTKQEPVNPNLVRYSDAGVLGNKDIFKRNRQVIIFSYIAVYGINVVDAYVAARLHYFNIDDNLSFKVSPTLINNPATMYGFNPSPALRLSLIF